MDTEEQIKNVLNVNYLKQFLILENKKMVSMALCPYVKYVFLILRKRED